MPVGDINSNEKGTGARYNDGKPAYSLLPLHVLVRWLRGNNFWGPEVAALQALADFQQREGADAESLFRALDMLALDDLYGLEEAVRVYDYGANKYASWNWAKGMAWSIPLECAVRHLLAALDDEENDPESGLSHLGHAQCNIIMLITFLETYPEGDDRPAPGLIAPVHPQAAQGLSTLTHAGLPSVSGEAVTAMADWREKQREELYEAEQEFEKALLEGGLSSRSYVEPGETLDEALERRKEAASE